MSLLSNSRQALNKTYSVTVACDGRHQRLSLRRSILCTATSSPSGGAVPYTLLDSATPQWCDGIED
jgi:hypothetical protein